MKKQASEKQTSRSKISIAPFPLMCPHRRKKTPSEAAVYRPSHKSDKQAYSFDMTPGDSLRTDALNCPNLSRSLGFYRLLEPLMSAPLKCSLAYCSHAFAGLPTF